MTSRVYPTFKMALMNGNAPNLLTDVLRVMLVDMSIYTYSDGHEFKSDLPSGSDIAISAILSGAAIGNDASFDTIDAMFSAVTGPQVGAIIGFVDTGNDATSRLIFFQDAADALGLPFTPNGSDITIIVADSGWFWL